MCFYFLSLVFSQATVTATAKRRRVDRRSANKCIVSVIGFLRLAAVLPVSIIGDFFPYGRVGTPACISIFTVISFLCDIDYIDPR